MPSIVAKTEKTNENKFAKNEVWRPREATNQCTLKENMERRGLDNNNASRDKISKQVVKFD